MAETEYFDSKSAAKLIDVKIIDFDKLTAKFQVVNEDLGISTLRSRVFMRLKTEPENVLLKLRAKVKRL